MRKFNIFLIIYFIILFILIVVEAIIESTTEYSLIILYFPYIYYLTVGLIIVKGWEILLRGIHVFSSNSLVSIFIKFIILVISTGVTLFISVFMLFFGGDASSEKIGDKEYIVVEHGILAATTKYYYERHNIFLMKKKESYSHKI